METKALLFLMNFSEYRGEVYYFIIDFFNDVSGMNSSSSKIWDVQSKGKKESGPTEIGRELVTLFKNFNSAFKFEGYILFLAGVTKKFRQDIGQNVFTISNVSEKSYKGLVHGLRDESLKKTYIIDSDVTDENIEDFLKEVIFVVDDKSRSEYVKEMIAEYPRIVAPDELLRSIFDEIKVKQSTKKDLKIVEGLRINTIDESLNYNRHLATGEIKLLTLQRIIAKDPITSVRPISFVRSFCEGMLDNEIMEVVEECRRILINALFNKNASQEFWKLFSEIYHLIIDNNEESVQQIFTRLDKNLIEEHPNFDVLSTKYLISIVKEGVSD